MLWNQDPKSHYVWLTPSKFQFPMNSSDLNLKNFPAALRTHKLTILRTSQFLVECLLIIKILSFLASEILISKVGEGSFKLPSSSILFQAIISNALSALSSPRLMSNANDDHRFPLVLLTKFHFLLIWFGYVELWLYKRFESDRPLGCTSKLLQEITHKKLYLPLSTKLRTSTSEDIKWIHSEEILQLVEMR